MRKSQISVRKLIGGGYRISQKVKHGVSFFTSQIIVDAKPVKSLLRSYDELCRKDNVVPRRIFLSFAPISRKKDIEFLKLLRVDVSESVSVHLFDGWLGTGYRSIELARTILVDILTFARENRFSVPLGLNISYVVRHNFELALELTRVLTEEYRKFF